VEGFAEEDFVIRVWLGVTYVEKSEEVTRLTLKLESVLAWITGIYR
jgi:hypothetical protein